MKGSLQARARRGLLLAGACLFATLTPTSFAQTDVRAWSAQGQVWIVWKDQNPLSKTYSVYSSEAQSPTAHCSDWELEANLFGQDATVVRLRDQADFTTNATRPRVPDGNGGHYQLLSDELVCVLTPHESRDARYAVLPATDCFVSSARQSERSAFVLDPVGDPIGNSVEPVVQVEGTETLASGEEIAFRIYCLWADGRADHTDRRADIPVLASEHRNATPSLFIMFAQPSMLLAADRDVVHFLHGGGGNAAKFRPGNASGIHLKPDTGFLISHDDALFIRANNGTVDRRLTYWFGYSQDYNPFLSVNSNPTLDETGLVVNYTQRRIRWINDWLIRRQSVDRDHCALMGFSVGSHGVSHIGRAFPRTWSTVTLLNHNPRSPGDSIGHTKLWGPSDVAVPTTLEGPGGAVVKTDTLWDIRFPISPYRDYPLFRWVHGTEDDNELEGWDEHLVDALHDVNEAGLGMQVFWDERSHACRMPDAAWSLPPYGLDDKLRRTDASFQRRYRATESYPAFFDVEAPFPGGRRLPMPPPRPIDPMNAGDAKGTWGGHIEWATPTDERHQWSVEAWLIDDEYSLQDQSVYARGWAKMTVRKARRFQPAPGVAVTYEVTAAATGQVLLEGVLRAGPRGLVRLDESFPMRRGERTRIRFSIPKPERSL